jgi:SAM-dependent methyltransferase
MEKLRNCPVCHSKSEDAEVFIENNLDSSKLTEFSFASRKIPEYMCYRLVKCKSCDLVYVDQPPSKEELAHEYHVAEYDSSEEANDAAEAYMKAIRPLLNQLVGRESALEIGTGTGVFIECLLQEGFKKIIGVEPSSAAIAAAPEYRRAWIREEIFEEKNFVNNSFDLICCFMTMEHVHDPELIAKAAYRLLRPDGAFVIVTHDYRSLGNRLLGKRSPVIDVEHMQLFSKPSLKYLFRNSGFTEFTVKDFVNTYSMHYWIRLAPLPYAFKYSILRLLKFFGLSKLKLGANVGNLISAGFKRV